MPILLIAGLLVLGVGVILFLVWLSSFVIVLKAIMPTVLIIGGGVATYLGWEEMRDSKGLPLDFSSLDEASRYQAEANRYQAEINGFQDGGAGSSEGITIKASFSELTVEGSTQGGDSSEDAQAKEPKQS